MRRTRCYTGLPDATAPNLAMASQRLAGYGVTGCTDMTPHNNAQTMAEFSRRSPCP